MAAEFMTETITIGLTASLSGKYKGAGLAQLQGIQMWRDDINERGALLGKRVELLVKDDHSNADDSTNFYEQFIVKDKVDLLLGPYSSDLTIAVAKVAEQYNFPLLAVAASASSIWDNRKNAYVFGTYVQSNNLMKNVIKVAVEKNIKRVAILHADTTYTNSVATGAKLFAQENNLNVIFYEMFNEKNNNIEDSVQRLAMADPELIIVGAYFEDSVAIVKAIKRQNIQHNMLVFSGSVDTIVFKKALGEDVEGILSVIQWSRSQHLPGAHDFSFRYKKKFGVQPSYQAAGGYAAGQILEAAVRMSGSLSKKILQKQLLELKFRSLFGHYRVGKNGRQIGKQAYLMQWQGGERVLVLPKKLVNHDIRLFNL